MIYTIRHWSQGTWAVIPILLVLCLTACGGESYHIQLGTFPNTPTNMGDINSEYDDYNSSSPIVGETGPLCFSSKRGSFGHDFDLTYMILNVIVNKATGQLEVSNDQTINFPAVQANANISDAVQIVNGFDSDELGPYLILQGQDSINQFILLYATNVSGNFDIRFTQNVSSGTYSDPMSVAFLNSPMDDLYPTLALDNSTIYFCSNRDGDFDIYSTTINPRPDLVSALSSSAGHTITKSDVLSSSSDDKCPFVLGNLMVFASDRAGGFGGFDLYYSLFSNGAWSEPVNFGDKINTASDEYRPIVKTFETGFTNDFMLFSSNRPGGKGGFDLYYVGIDKMTK